MLRLVRSVPQKAPNNPQDSWSWVNAFLSDLCNMILLTEIYFCVCETLLLLWLFCFDVPILEEVVSQI